MWTSSVWIGVIWLDLARVEMCIDVYIAKPSSSFNFNWTESVIFSANPDTRHHPDKYKYIFLELKHERQGSFFCSYEL